MKTITIDDVLASGYCGRYTPEIIRRLWGDRETATALDVLDSHLPVEDRLWLMLNVDILSDETVRTFRAALAFFAADIYEKYYPADSRVSDCAEAWRAFAAGEIGADALAAAMDAAYDAACAAARAAARAAACSAAWDAAWAAARAAARAAAWDDIVSWLRDIVEVMDDDKIFRLAYNGLVQHRYRSNLHKRRPEKR